MTNTDSFLTTPIPRHTIVGAILGPIAAVAIRSLWLEQGWPFIYAATFTAFALFAIFANNWPQVRANGSRTVIPLAIFIGVVTTMIALVESRL